MKNAPRNSHMWNKPKAGFKGILSAAVILIAAFLLSVTASHAKDPAGGEAGNCVSCHPKAAEFAAKANVHQPVKQGRCTACHNPHASKHSGLLADAGKALCYKCHDSKKGFDGAAVHRPVAEGKCLSCHEAHSSDSRGLMKLSAGELCYSCHKKEDVAGKKYVHPEVRKNNCKACHSPHSSQTAGLLVKDRTALCADCHYGKASPGARQCVYDSKGSDCLSCHSPHSSDRKGLIKASMHKPFEEKKCASCHAQAGVRTLKPEGSDCLGCHKTTLDSFNTIYSHASSGPTARFCESCHNPHASDVLHLLRDKEERVCYRCHADTAEYVAKSKHKHSKLGECSSCHSTHGSNSQFFLKQGDQTCSMAKCHPVQGTFTHPVGEKAIDPRSKTPMTCSTCHNPMGSPEAPILIEEKDKELCVRCHQL